MANKYQKKYIDIFEAVQLDWSTWNEVCDFVPKGLFGRGVWVHKDGGYSDEPRDQNTDVIGLIVRCNSGTCELAVQSDWIVKDNKGLVSICSPDEFNDTYMPITTSTSSLSEALYAFASWLTTRNKQLVLSAKDDVAPVAELVAAFCKVNNLDDPRDGWEKNLVFPEKDI